MHPGSRHRRSISHGAEPIVSSSDRGDAPRVAQTIPARVSHDLSLDDPMGGLLTFGDPFPCKPMMVTAFSGTGLGWSRGMYCLMASCTTPSWRPLRLWGCSRMCCPGRVCSTILNELIFQRRLQLIWQLVDEDFEHLKGGKKDGCERSTPNPRLSLYAHVLSDITCTDATALQPRTKL